MADDSSVKMETLKKAYAEIILNTSKEAAARIMVADRRAFCFEKDLIAVKAEAVRLLVQLKQTLDFKTAEAEVKSENQQKKIEVLEAQLSEAEGIIVDLREELRMTQDTLEEVKCSQRRPLKCQNSEDFEDQPQSLDNELITKTIDGRYHTVQYSSTENAIEDQFRKSAGEQPSTHFQPSVLSSVYQSADDVCSTKNLTEKVLQCSSVDQFLRFDEEKPSTSFRPSILSRGNASVNMFGDVKAGKERCSSCSSEPDEQDAKLASNGSHTRSQEYESHQGQSIRDGSRRNRKNLKYQEAIAALRRSSHGRNAKACHLPFLSKCRTKASKQDTALVEVPDNNEACPTPGSSYKMDSKHDSEWEKSIEFGGKVRSGLMEGDIAGKESDCNLHISEDEESAGISNRVDCDKVLKFTFQRKRKRELLKNLENDTTPEGKNVKSRALIEKGDAAKREKSSVKDDQSKDGRQLLQIAHQLISLSGNGHS